MNWAEYITAFVVFFVTHSIPLRPMVREPLTRALGRPGFGIVYSAISLAVLAWLTVAAGRAPYLALWSWAPWQNLVPLVAMALTCALLCLAIGRPNPFSFGGGRPEAYDPDHPGLVAIMRHPLLVALAIWAASHMVPNGDLAHVLLFGAFAGFAWFGQRAVDRRKKRMLGAEWTRLNALRRTSSVRFSSTKELYARLSASALLYAGLLWAHPWLFGVTPLTGLTD